MKRHPKFKRAARIVLRHASRFLALPMISFGVPQFFFPIRNVSKSFLSESSAIQQNLLCLLISAVLFAVTVSITSANDLEFAKRWQIKKPKVSLWAEMRFLLTDPIFLIKVCAFALVLLFLPLPVLSLSASDLLGVGMGFASKLPIIFAAAPVYLVLALLARRHAIALFREGYLPQEKKNTRAFVSMLTLVFSFITAIGVLILIALPFILAMLSLLFHKTVDRILITLALIFLLVFITVTAVMLRRRRRFIKHMMKLCARSGISLTVNSRSWLSVLFFYRAESFRLEVEDKTYSCMLIFVRRKRLPILIDVDGWCVFYHSLRMLGDEVLHYEIKRRINYPTEHQRILIFSPAPHILKCRENGQTADLDNGDCAGDYKVFSRGAFLRALERGSLDR